MSLPDTSFLKDIHAYRDRRRSTQKKNQKKLFWGHLMQGLAGKINDARKEAREDFKTEQAKADANIKFLVEREAEKDSLQNIAEGLKNYGVSEDAIMWYAKDGPESLKSMNKQVTKLISDATAVGVELDNETIQEILNVPIDFKPDGKTLDTFFDEMYGGYKNLNKEDPPKDPQGFLENLQLAASGITGDRAYQQRRREAYYKDYSIDDINRIARQTGTSNPFGDVFSASSVDLTAFPRMLDDTDVGTYQRGFDKAVETALKDKENRYEWYAKNVDPDVTDDIFTSGSVAWGDMVDPNSQIYKAYTEDTRRKIAPQYLADYNFDNVETNRFILEQLSNIKPYVMDTTGPSGDGYRWSRQDNPATEVVPSNEFKDKMEGLDLEYKRKGYAKGDIVRVIHPDKGILFIELGKGLTPDAWENLT